MKMPLLIVFMTKSIGKSMVSLFARGVSTLVAILAPGLYVDCPHDLTSHLGSDPVVNASLNSVAHALYYRFGIYIAPLAASIILAEHIKYNHKNEPNDEPGEEPGVRGETGGRDEPYPGHKCPLTEAIILGANTGPPGGN